MATDSEILKAFAKNAFYIVELETKISTLLAEVDELVEMLEAIKHNAIREDANTDKDIGIWIAKFSDEGMASLKILIDKHRSK